MFSSSKIMNTENMSSMGLARILKRYDQCDFGDIEWLRCNSTQGLSVTLHDQFIYWYACRLLRQLQGLGSIWINSRGASYVAISVENCIDFQLVRVIIDRNVSIPFDLRWRSNVMDIPGQRNEQSARRLTPLPNGSSAGSLVRLWPAERRAHDSHRERLHDSHSHSQNITSRS